MIKQIEIREGEEGSLPDGDYILRDGAAWLTVNGLTVRIRAVGTGIDIKVWDGTTFNDPMYEANVDPEWEDKDKGPWPNAMWYDTSKELE